MTKLSSRNTPRVVKGNFVCVTNRCISYCDGPPTLTNVVEHLQCAESDDSKSCDRTSAVSTKIATSSRVQFSFSVFTWKRHGLPMCINSGTKMNVPPAEYTNEEAPSVGGSVLWRQQREYASYKDEIP